MLGAFAVPDSNTRDTSLIPANLKLISFLRASTSALALSLTMAPALMAQEGGDGAEIIRGRVFGPDSLPLRDAEVTVLGVQTEISQTTRTNDQGLYTVLFPDPEGDYLVTIRYIGLAPQTHRVTTQGSTSRLLVQDVRLSAVPQQLEAVSVVGAQDRRAPRQSDDRSVGGKEQNALGGKLFSLDPSDLNALAASVPGILRLPGADGSSDGFSVLGLPADQNKITVDGTTFEGSTLPEDAVARAAVKTTTYDPSQGQFSGGQLSIGTRGGNNNFAATVRATAMPPGLAWADPASPTPLPRDLSWSGTIGGPIRRGKAFYFGSLESKRVRNDLMSLLIPNETALAERGIAIDTVDLFASRLTSLGVPLTTGAIPGEQLNDRWSTFARIDVRPTATTSISVRGDGNWNRSDGAGISALTFPAQGNGRRSDKLGLQASTAMYFGGFLSELKTYLQRTTSSSEPYVFLPRGDVRVGTFYEDGRIGLTSMGFGGGNARISTEETRRWETKHEFSWMTVDSRHRLKFGQQFSLWRTTSHALSDPFGRFSYASLMDLDANRPASYSRTLDSRERSSSGVEAALWIGDEWRQGDRLRVETGVRVDIARSGTRPMYNPAVDSLFALRTDEVPGDIGFSPRIGFSWVMRPMQMDGSAGPERPARGGTPRPGAPTSSMNMSPPRMRAPLTLSGGFGAFRGVIAPAEVATLSDLTGLPNTVRNLTCVGDATPIPDWALYASDPGAIPVACLDGGAPTEFSDSQPRVGVYDPDFHAPLSWRGNLSLDGLTLGDWRLSLGATQQVGFNGKSAIDENLRRTPLFTLLEEDARPVFVAPTSIVETTGDVAPAAARISDRFGPVIRNVSDLRNVATQLSASVSPPRPIFGRLPFSANYTFTHNRTQERGFSGSTAGDPFLKAWAEGTHPTHQLALQSSLAIKWINLGFRANIYSGSPYTPMVAGDVNGDGMRNDRAFVFDPETTSDPQLAGEMRALLDAAPERARDCLLDQVGHVVARNSCSTGWRFQPDISLGLRLPTDRLPSQRNMSIWDRLTFSVKADNIVGALLRLVNLDIPSGWGRDRASPDQTLLYVEGFDPATQQFRYRVNQQFGDVTDRSRTRRNRLGGGAFRIQLGSRLTFGGPSQRSMAERLGFIPRRGEPAMTIESAKDRLRQRTSDPLEPLLARRDSLALTSDQLTQLGSIGTVFQARVDTAITPLAEYIVKEGRRLRDTELQTRLAKLFPEMRALMRDALVGALALLTEEQRARVPERVRSANGEGRK